MKGVLNLTIRHSHKLLISCFILTQYNKVTKCQINKEPLLYNLLTSEEINQMQKKYKNLMILDQNTVEHIITHLRDKQTNTKDYRHYSDRIIRLLFEQALALHDKVDKKRLSPIGYYNSREIEGQDSDYCVVSILRSGNAFLPPIFEIIPGITVGQILIQRNEETAVSSHFYTKLPQNIQNKKIFLVDPMLATGGSAILAVQVLKEKGVEEKNIIFVNIISCEVGVNKFLSEYPNIRIITAQMDPLLLKDSKYLAPGLGDYGDRYYGTQQ